MQQEIQQFAQVYAIDTQRIHVRESTINNPSSFLTNSGIKACVLAVNKHADAKRVWSHFLDSGHELTHCLMSEKGKRVEAKKATEAFELIYKRVKSIRTDFSNRDPDHNSAAAQRR